MTSIARNILGVVLAGGRSRRFGTSKVLTEVGGSPLAGWAIASLKEAGLSVGVISSEDGLESALGVPVRPDLEPDKGPLGGLLTALAWAREKKKIGVFLLGCDMPFVTAGLIEVLLSNINGSTAVVPVGRIGPEPLCSFYHLSCRQTVRELLDSQDRSMHGLLKIIKTKEVLVASEWGIKERDHLFFNVNTREEAAEAEDILTRRERQKIEG